MDFLFNNFDLNLHAGGRSLSRPQAVKSILWETVKLNQLDLFFRIFFLNFLFTFVIEIAIFEKKIVFPNFHTLLRINLILTNNNAIKTEHLPHSSSQGKNKLIPKIDIFFSFRDKSFYEADSRSKFQKRTKIKFKMIFTETNLTSVRFNQ